MQLLAQAKALVGAKLVSEGSPRRLSSPSAKAAAWPPSHISLALQGGGSFGAFTAGVLDRLLDEDKMQFDAISGASAGAVNGVLMAAGLLEGGQAGAKDKLKKFWRRMSDEASFLSLTTMPGLAGSAMGFFGRQLSPAQFNPFDLNPLRRVLASEVDFESLRDPRAPRLLVAATRVSDGQLRIFRNDELTVDVILASACLPLVHRSVEIDGELYWDGGYVANPPIIQLVHEGQSPDLLVVQVTPARHGKKPATTSEIEKRLDQITFNAVLNTEIEALRLARKVGATQKLDQLRVTLIAAEDEVEDLSDHSAANLGLHFLRHLRESGQKAAEAWMENAPADAISHVV